MPDYFLLERADEALARAHRLRSEHRAIVSQAREAQQKARETMLELRMQVEAIRRHRAPIDDAPPEGGTDHAI
jgi:hypothetical protein